MKEFVVLLLVIVVWLILQIYVLPRLGIST